MYKNGHLEKKWRNSYRIRSAYTSLRDLSYDVEHEVMAEIYGSCPFVIHDLSDSGIPMRLTYDIDMSLIPPLGREPFADSEFCAYLCTRYIMTGAVPQACSLAGRRVCPPPKQQRDNDETNGKSGRAVRL